VPPLARFFPLIIVAAAVLCYVNTLPNEFTFDDEWYILDQPVLRDLDRTMTEAWSQRRPLLLISFALNHHFDGYAQPGYHAVNLLIHALAGLALFGFVRRTLELTYWQGRFDQSARYLAGAVALLWVVHPLATQAVTYTVQRGESMMGLFLFTTLYLYVLGAAQRRVAPRIAWHALAILACLLGMLSKENMVIAPLLVLAYDAVFLNPAPGRFLKRRLWVVIGLLLTAAVLLNFMGSVLVDPFVATPDGRSTTVGLGVASVTWWQYLQSQAYVIVVIYLAKVFAPVNLVLDYFLAPVTGWRVVAPFAFLTVGLIVSVLGVFLRRWWGFVGLGFYLALAPTSSVLPVVDLAVEHRMYVPLAFAIALVVGIGSAVGRHARWRGWASSNMVKTAGFVATAICAVMLAALTVQRNAEYRTRVSVWETVVERRPLNPRGYHNLGSALQSEKRFEESVRPFQIALKMVPTYAEARNGFAVALRAMGDMDGAEAQYLVGLENTPSHKTLNYNYARLLFTQGQTERAIEYLQAAIKSDPEYVAAYSNLGAAQLALGRFDEAEQSWQAALAIDPGSDFSASNLVTLYLQQGRAAEALAAAEAMMQHTEQLGALNYFAYGRALLRSGKLIEAEAALRSAAAGDRPLPQAAARLMGLYIRQGRSDEARAMFEQATQYSGDPGLNALVVWTLATTPLPDDTRVMAAPAVLRLAQNVVAQQGDEVRADALEALAAALANTGQFEPAAAAQRRAIEIAEAGNLTAWQREQMNERLGLYEAGKVYVAALTSGDAQD